MKLVGICQLFIGAFVCVANSHPELTGLGLMVWGALNATLPPASRERP